MRFARVAMFVSLTLATGNREEVMALPAPLVAQVPAITEERFDWNHCSVRSEVPPVLRARGCVGERVPLSFLAMCPGEMHRFAVSVSALRGRDIIPARAWDLRWVKWQWWSGEQYYQNDKTTWAPAMLLHDWDLVRSDPNVPEVNLFPDRPEDAASLVPSYVPDTGIGYTRQVYMVLKIPHVRPGLYEGRVTLTSDETEPTDVPLRLYVWAFALQGPGMDTSICYRSHLLPEQEPPPFGTEGRTPAQMREDLRNMVEHGFTNPNVYEGCGRNIPRVLGLRRVAGCDNRRLFLLGGYQGMPANKDWYANWGVQEVCVFGPNEDRPEELPRLRERWRESQRTGAKVWGFCNFTGFEDYLEDAVDVVVTGWNPGQDTARLVERLHNEGKLVYFYGHPQAGSLAPEVYRRNWGVRSWALGADGIMPYAYQHVFGGGHPWDDFAVRREQPRGVYRSHMMTYPTLSKPIDTLSWEGAAAGILDVRYLRTLQAALAAWPNCPLRDRAAAFLDRVREEAGTIGLDDMRHECARLIAEIVLV